MILVLDAAGNIVDRAWTMMRARAVADWLTKTTKQIHTVKSAPAKVSA